MVEHPQKTRDQQRTSENFLTCPNCLFININNKHPQLMNNLLLGE